MKFLVSLLLMSSVVLSGCSLKELFVYTPPQTKQYGYDVMGEAAEQKLVVDWLEYAADTSDYSVNKRKNEISRLQSVNELEAQGRLILLLAGSNSATHLEQARKLASEQLSYAQKGNNEILANFLQLVITQIKSQHDAVVTGIRLQQQIEQAKLLTKQINALKSIEKSIYEREYGITDSGE